MRSFYIFLLVYLQGSFTGGSNAHRNSTCDPIEACGPVPDTTSHFLQCVGLPSTDTGPDHMHRLKEMLEATMDMYTFVRSSMRGVPFLSLQGELELNWKADPLQNEDLVRMWLEVKIKPLLKSITKQFLTCLSTKNFSCSTYQTVVKELSHQYSDMDPARQKWIYMFFMYPFLSGDRVAGCVNPGESSEEWLMKNFGSFRAMARMKDFSTLNMVFSGLEVLHLLSPEQKAELLLSPEVAGLDNGTLSLVFHSLMTGGSGPPPTAGPTWSHNWTTPGWGHNWTSPGGSLNWTSPGGSPNWTSPGWGYNYTSPRYPSISPSYPPQPYPPSPQHTLKEVAEGFMMAFEPISSFVHDFVSFTKERDVSEIRSTTLSQFLLNWTLSELADMYRPPDTTAVPEIPNFDLTNVEDWYQQVVMPLLQRFLPDDTMLMHENITLAFHNVFYLDHGKGNESSEILDVCSITLDKNPCTLTDTVKNVAHVLHCAARTNLTMNEETLMRLMEELTKRLTSLVKELSTANFTEVASDFQQIFREPESPSLTQEHLEDPDFIKLWFQIKMLPHLPDVHSDLLSCLSTKNFSCPVYQTIVADFSRHMTVMDAYPMHSQNIYEHFIYSFLLHHNTSDPQCVFSANHTAEWLEENFGYFSRFASITDFYQLSPRFSGLEVLHLLSPKQTAEMLLLPLPTPPQKDVVIEKVFEFLLESPELRKLPEVLHFVVQLAKEVDPPCDVYKQMLEQLYQAIPTLPPDVELATWAAINDLTNVAPAACVPNNLTCPVIQFNETKICKGVNSSDLQYHLNTSMQVPCNVTLEKYVCAQLDNFTATQLVSLMKCNLSGNSSHSKMLWKMLLTKVSPVLDPALDMLDGMPMPLVIPSAVEILDVIGEMRVSRLSDEQLMNSSVIRLWFSDRLSSFLPSASGVFLRCLSNKNLSCQSYQQILQVFSDHFEKMTLKQQHMVLKTLILRFLQQPHSAGPGCVSAFNSSAEWLKKNLGPFSVLLSLKELLDLNPQFNPLEVIPLLTPEQSAELVMLPLPNLPEKDVVVSTLFDYFTESPNEKKFSEFLSYLVTFSPQGNLSCSSYRTLFTRLDLAMATASLQTVSSITYTKMALSKHIPPGCIIYSTQCNVTITNETDICVGINSTKLQLLLDSGNMSGRFCEFSVEEFACASLSALTAQDLAEMLKCNRSSSSSGSRPVWKLLLSKASLVLDEALDLLTNTTLNPKNPAVSMILNAIREIRFDNITVSSINDPALIRLWFNRRLLPFLSAVSPDFLSCFITKGLNCSTYQHIVQILTRLQPNMTLSSQMSVYTHFIKVFLTRNNTADPTCSLNINNSAQWVEKNLGGFSVFVPFNDLLMLYPNFSAMEALSQLSVRQLSELSSTPGQLTSAEQVNMVMKHVPSHLLAAFFDDYSPAIMGNQNMIPSPVRSAMLQVVFDRANLSDPSLTGSVVSLWLHNRLRPLLVNLSPSHVAPFFGILAGRNCSLEQQGVEDLNLTISTLSENTQAEIYNHIIKTLKGPEPLRCYGDNYNHSFYSFIVRSFMGFQFPNLTTFLSLMPHNKMHQLVNSITIPGLGDFLRRPDVVDSEAQLCALYQNYNLIQMFLQKESLPEGVMLSTLECVWPIALSSSKRADVEMWFTKSLLLYYPLLRKDMISPNVTHNASCLAFQHIVKILGDHNYTAAAFTRQDVFITIRDYLISDTVPRCYSVNDPELNSTAWFAEYIGSFMPFLTLDILQTFGSAAVLQVFTVNPQNIALLNHSVLPQNLTDYYTQLVYQQDSNFNPLLLPLLCRCVAPGPAFSQLTADQSMALLPNLTILCTNLDPQQEQKNGEKDSAGKVSAALAGNFGDNIDAMAIATLGSESIGISTGQLKTINPQDLFSALDTIRGVMGWNKGQARAIIQALMSSGMMKIDSSSSLFMLGSLIVGVPTRVFRSISVSQLLTASRNTSILAQLMFAPQIVQQTFVTQIVSLNTNSEEIIQNIPDELATEIPRALLLSFSDSNTVITTLNKKKWKRQQAELFFSVISTESATAQLGNPNNLSSSVLQGFTCTGVRTIQRVQIKRLVRACRRRGKNKVKLVETQLTCMYNYIRVDSDATNFSLYPPDMLLYYDYSLVLQASCRPYFEQLADADFSVFSSALSYKRNDLFNNAKSCLDIKNTSLTADSVSVLGNMCCILDESYIQNSDPSILEKLNNCPEITDPQAAAVEIMLSSGKTQYGAPSTWDEQTLKDLGMLPLYLKSTFYTNFNKKKKRTFLKYFLKVLRENKVGRQKRRRMKREIRRSNRVKSKRSIGNECTVGEITRVTISDETFPFDYDDINQFNSCLTAKTVENNLNAITEKVDQEEYLEIVLSKLREAYAANSTIPESQVQVLGPASRLATVEDINKWTITQIDTLAALMDQSDGEWDPNLAQAVITKYLSTEGNTLGSEELNVIEGPNLCSLGTDVLKNISQQSLKDASALTVSNCTTEKKKELFTIARQAFGGNARSTVTVSSYQLIQPYMGGATSDYVRSLGAANVSMDMATFTSLDENVVLNLTVSEVKDLLGTNLPDLKSYENQTLVQSWISRQAQSQLDTLGIELTGGKADPTTSTPSASSNSTAASPSNSTTAITASPTSTTASSAATTVGSGSSSSTATSSTTTGNGTRIRADTGFSLLVLLALLITSQHAVM